MVFDSSDARCNVMCLDVVRCSFVSGTLLRRVRDVDMKHDYAFVEFSDPRDADDARHYLNGRELDGTRIIVEFARRGPRGPGGSREYLGRGPAPGTGRCYNCGNDGHWARDCKAGDWKNKCYRCGQRGHIERNCHSSPRYDRSPSRHSRSRSHERERSLSRSYSKSRSYSPPRRSARNPASAGHRSDSRSPSITRSPRRQESRSRSQSPVRNGRSLSRSPLRGDVSRSVSSSPVRNRETNGLKERKSPIDDRSSSRSDD
eukprot:c25958_g4_i4 orf=690-1466(+)